MTEAQRQATRPTPDIRYHSVLTAGHRDLLNELLVATTAFDDAEIGVALELFDNAVSNPASDYHFLLAESGTELAGYVCFGPTPMTDGTFDLYWLVTHPRWQRRGVARKLVDAMETSLRARAARLVRVETSSKEAYGAARGFYSSVGYEEAVAISDFYRSGDDLVIFVKRLDDAVASQRRADSSFESVYDMAFDYRDFDRERDFLRACSVKFGRGEPQRVIEWASGPSRHLQSFAQLEGVQCVGVELAKSMIELARERLGDDRSVRILQGDMRTTRVSPPADLAFTMLSSIHVLTTEQDMVKHLETCAASLSEGGIYVIEATHPRDLEPGGSSVTSWQQDHMGVTVRGQFTLDVARASGHRIPATLRLERIEGEERREFRVDMPWLVLDMEGWKRVLAEVPSFEIAAMLGDLDVSLGAERTTAWRLVLVLRRR